FIALVQQEFGQIGAVLTGNASNECNFVHGIPNEDDILGVNAQSVVREILSYPARPARPAFNTDTQEVRMKPNSDGMPAQNSRSKRLQGRQI
ncbi:hypothetical protein, partial [Paludibacterium yongneupense]|uniref:hypothetical protein n=1 Tax=Paludibacterium yongneupense TaxID=400061 RepID=UPI003D158284